MMLGPGIRDTGINGALALRLQWRERESDWAIWEHKTFNIHRGVLHWCAPDNLGFQEIAHVVRQRVKQLFPITWWRGFAFGVLIESPRLPPDVVAIDATIDTRASGQGTWQWTVLAAVDTQTAVGVHTWKAGYLSETYRQLLKHFEAKGYLVGSFKKEKDKLMQFLTMVAGLKGIKFSEFEP